jgi:hypothetical protein
MKQLVCNLKSHNPNKKPSFQHITLDEGALSDLLEHSEAEITHIWPT